MNMIKSLLTQLSNQTEFVQKQNYELQREVLVNRKNAKSRNKTQSNNNVLPHKDKSFQQMAVVHCKNIDE